MSTVGGVGVVKEKESIFVTHWRERGSGGGEGVKTFLGNRKLGV